MERIQFSTARVTAIDRLADLLDEAIRHVTKDPENRHYSRILKRISRFINERVLGITNKRQYSYGRKLSARSRTTNTSRFDELEEEVRAQALKEANQLQAKLVKKGYRKLGHARLTIERPNTSQQFQTTYQSSYNESSTLFAQLERKFDTTVQLDDLEYMLRDESELSETASVMSDVRTGDFDIGELELVQQFIRAKAEAGKREQRIREAEESARLSKNRWKEIAGRSHKSTKASRSFDGRKKKTKPSKKFNENRPRPLVIKSPNHLASKQKRLDRPAQKHRLLGEPEILESLRQIDKEERDLTNRREKMEMLLKQKRNSSEIWRPK